MSLRLKINIIVGLLTLVFVTAVMALQLRSLRDAVREEIVGAHRVATQILQRTAWLYTAQGTAAMQGFLQGVGRVRANDIRLLDSEGRELYRSPPSTYKAGRDAPAWFAALITPKIGTQSIQFPGGRLETTPDATRAVLDAWDEMLRLAAVAVGVMLAVLALVAWLVGRAVRPFARIVGALDELQAGRFDASLPRLPGREAGAIATAFNRMVAQLRDHIETEKRAVRAESQLSDSRELARWVDRHVEDERRHIARELHDEFGQSVTAMRSMALAVAHKAQGRDTEVARTATLIADEALRLYDAMHGVIPRLAPLVLDSFGLDAALEELVRRTRAAHPGLELALRAGLGGVAVDADAALALYRAAQEGLSNALRHGEATQVVLQLEAAADAWVLSVVDNGRGLPGPRPGDGHYGLRWLAERAQALGGSLVVEDGAGGAEGGGGAPRKGVRLTMRLPRREPAAPSEGLS